MPIRVAVPVVIAAALLVGAASAQADQFLVQDGRTGSSRLVEPARCQYFGTGGVDSRYLELAVSAPAVKGVNLRRGRKDWSRARFAVWVVDAADNYRSLASSEWSSWMRVNDRRVSQWPGVTSFTAGFRGAYSLEVRVDGSGAAGCLAGGLTG